MPYIVPETDREHIGERAIAYLALLARTVPSKKKKGSLNYSVTRLAMQVFEPQGYTDTSDMINAILDASDGLRDAAIELRRRVMDPYEDKMIKKNGDIPEIEEFLGVMEE